MNAKLIIHKSYQMLNLFSKPNRQRTNYKKMLQTPKDKNIKVLHLSRNRPNNLKVSSFGLKIYTTVF